MYPVLFTVAGIPISSFGFFLLLAIFAAVYTIWKLAYFYELNVEKIFDLILLSLFGWLLGARLYFILFHRDLFNSLSKIFLINRFPGLSFWGGLLIAVIMLRIFSKKFKMNFWTIMDFAVVGLFLGISISSIGCFLGGCQSGIPSNAFYAVSQAGLVGKRLPIQIIEAVIFFGFFIYLWKRAKRFHLPGQVAYKGIILLGILKFIFDFYRGETQKWLGLGLGQYYALLVLLFGVVSYYKISKKSFRADIRFILGVLARADKRKIALTRLSRAWYNQKVAITIALKKWPKRIQRLFHLKPNPDKFKP
jgi:phosphatidylglycerol---prolipoprotein diacylglyceryl transferase